MNVIVDRVLEIEDRIANLVSRADVVNLFIVGIWWRRRVRFKGSRMSLVSIEKHIDIAHKSGTEIYDDITECLSLLRTMAYRGNDLIIRRLIRDTLDLGKVIRRFNGFVRRKEDIYREISKGNIRMLSATSQDSKDSKDSQDAPGEEADSERSSGRLPGAVQV